MSVRHIQALVAQHSQGGIWRGGRKGAEGLCIYCARKALRELDPHMAEPVVVAFPVSRGRTPDEAA